MGFAVLGSCFACDAFMPLHVSRKQHFYLDLLQGMLSHAPFSGLPTPQMQNNDPKFSKTAQKAIILDTSGVQVKNCMCLLDACIRTQSLLLCPPFYLEGHGNLVSRLITPITHIVTPVIPLINPLTKSPLTPQVES